jgi:hypothetical protein
LNRGRTSQLFRCLSHWKGSVCGTHERKFQASHLWCVFGCSFRFYLSLSFCMYVCLSIYLSACMSLSLSIYLHVCMSVSMSIYLSMCLSVCMHISLSIYISVCLYVCLSLCLSIYISMALQPFVGPWPLSSFLIIYTVCRTPWTGDQPVSRLLPTHRTIQTEWTQTDIHASSEVRTHDLSVQAGEDSSCPRSRGHCDRRYILPLRKYNNLNHQTIFLPQPAIVIRVITLLNDEMGRLGGISFRRSSVIGKEFLETVGDMTVSYFRRLVV